MKKLAVCRRLRIKMVSWPPLKAAGEVADRTELTSPGSRWNKIIADQCVGARHDVAVFRQRLVDSAEGARTIDASVVGTMSASFPMLLAEHVGIREYRLRRE
jgi:hypothetical protein